ncbi:MAG: NAD-dependent epimerase/dehydratase family protein [Nitrosarchaeum sp.]|nr:NAD-dependent epimerase/dehydratase family protein [Nitrosarchaeum sp.]
MIVDNLHSGEYKYVKKFIDSGKAQFFKIDIRNKKNLMKLPKVPAVIHLAAIASVLESIDNPSYVNDVNVSGTLNMLEFCRKKKIKKFIFTSSAAIFGNHGTKKLETTKTIPNTVYSSSKLTGEQYCRIYSELFGMNIVCLRPFNIYGPRQNDAYAGVISKFADRIRDNKPPIIFGDGKQTRDFIHVTDVVKAYLLALKYNKKKFDVFNLATGKSTSVNDLANLFLKSSNKSHLKPIHKKSIPGVIKYDSANNAKIKKILGFSPSIKLQDGISQLWEYVKFE